MELTIFAKKRTGEDGKSFYGYLTTLETKTKEKRTVSVKFREECGAPAGKDCPCNIVVDKKNCNMAEHDYVDEATGEERVGYTLWVSAWTKGSKYVDRSLDDYNFG